MPELPEVESVRRGLEPLAGRAVVDVQVRRRKVVVLPGDPAAGWSRSGATRRPVRVDPSLLLVGDTLRAPVRVGKQLGLVGDRSAVGVHLGMTGRLALVGEGEPITKHAHVVWTFEGGDRLAFVDARRFGGVWGFAGEALLRAARFEPLGPDALGVRASTLRNAFEGRRASVKAVLLDQRAVAGVGNIYADEALFLSGVHPTREAGSLSSEEATRLASCVRLVLREAVAAGGTTLRDFADPGGGYGGYQAQRRVYGRAGEPCPACGRELDRLLVAQRGTTACARCQR